MKVPGPESSRIHDKIVPIPDYAIPCISSGDDSSSRTVKNKAIQDVNRETPIHPDPVYRHPPKQVKLPIPKVARSLLDIDQEVNMGFNENSQFQEGEASETYQRPDKSYFQEPQELDSLCNTGRFYKVLTEAS